MVKVKICGVRTPEHAVAGVELGADLIGIILAPSRRQVQPAAAQAIAAAAHAAAARRGRTVGVVGVFVNAEPATINELVARIGLDWVQLSGHEPTAAAALIGAPVVKAVRFDAHPSEADWLGQPQLEGARRAPLLVDAHVAGSFGGAGVTGDWTAAAELARRRPVWLAGGLTPGNVADAIQAVSPAVVDVSSGVETDGVKDIEKIEAFIRAAQAAPQTDNAPDTISTHLLEEAQ